MSEPKPLSITDTQKRFHAAAQQVKIKKTSGVFGGKSKAQRIATRTAKEKKYLFA